MEGNYHVKYLNNKINFILMAVAPDRFFSLK